MPNTDFHEFTLPKEVKSIEFISDLHLDPATPATFNAWHSYMQSSQADVIFILGDLFESWIGDDIVEATPPIGDFERQCAQIIKEASTKSKIYFICGNRDFLIQQSFAELTGMTLLPDPSLLLWDSKRIILSHGDLLCTDDIEYQKFRLMVHNPAWQAQALAMPIELRVATAQQMREKSEAMKKANVTADALDIMDVNDSAVESWLSTAKADLMIHGHTHRPADHTLKSGGQRIVLSDWDLESKTNPRAEVLRYNLGEPMKRVSLV